MDDESRFWRRWAGVAAVLLLAFMGVLAGGSAARESVTIDEVAHIGAGLSYWQRLDMRMNEEHPPLPKLLAGFPLLLRGTHADYEHVSWRESQGFFPALLGEWVFGDWLVTQWNEPTALLRWARLPMLALMLALGGVLFAYGSRLGGPLGGVLCVAVYASAPVFLAFGPLVLTDTAITLFSLVTLWQFAETWERPELANVRRLALALAAALLSKFSAAILLLALFVFVLATRYWPVAGQPATRPEAREWRRRRWRALRASIFRAGLIVYAVYLLFSWNQKVDIPGLGGHGPILARLGSFLMPPWIFLRGLLLFLLTSARPTFLLGQWHAHGVWFYFPVAFVLKSAPGFLALLLLAAVLAVVPRIMGGRKEAVVPESLRTHWRLLCVALVVFTLVCLMSPMEISIRHFSVPIALLMLLLASTPRRLARLRPPARALGMAACVLLAASGLVTAARSYPHYLPYVNALGLGHPVYELLNDSNVDWNQSLPEVERFARAHGVSDLPLDEYGLSHTTPWVRQSHYWDCQTPAAEDAGRWVVVSANMILDSHNCVWLRQYPQEVLAGGSLYAFHLPDPIPAAGTPGGPPLPAGYHRFPSQRGGIDMRVVLLDAVWHPEKIPEINARMAEEFQKARAAAQK